MNVYDQIEIKNLKTRSDEYQTNVYTYLYRICRLSGSVHCRQGRR